ncbi:MAG: hypothetical protein FWF18_05920, partial [Dehalococcoidia bacterium]|nr:hypothetical protein [Dehalococcoidia bacterium]
MNWKKLSGLISVVVVCLAMISVTACSSPNESRYNPNPDVSGKVIGSDNDFISRVIPVILNDVLYSSNCVIIGEVLDDNVVESKLEVPWGTMPWYHTIASVKVLETISGEPPSSDIISYRQGGVGDSYQTKVKK